MRRICIILLLLNSIIALSQETKYVNANELNIRSGAGKDFEVVTKATKNEKVNVISENGNWTEIETENGTKGFVSSKYLSNSNVEDEDISIGDYPISTIFTLVVVILLMFNSLSSKSKPSKRNTKKTIINPKQTIVKEKPVENIQRVTEEKEELGLDISQHGEFL